MNTDTDLIINADEENLRKYLQDLYYKRKMSLRKISKELQIPLTTLFVMFEQLGIRTRTQKQSMKLWNKQKSE